MNTETFNKLLDELDGNSLETLKQKNAKYASDNDCLHNFESGAEIMGSTPAQCAWGYLTKHLVALRDKVERDDFSDREDFLEKCQDIINYIRFIWVIGNDREAENVMDEIVKTFADNFCGWDDSDYMDEDDYENCLHYCIPSRFEDLACRTCVATTSNHRGSNFVKKEN